MTSQREGKGAAVICLSFRNTGRCRWGENCKFEHVSGDPIASLQSWTVSGLPADATAENVSVAFASVLQAACAPEAAATELGCGFETVLHARGGNAKSPYAHVTAAQSGAPLHDEGLLSKGVEVRGVLCSVRRRRESKNDRIAAQGRCLAAKRAAEVQREQRQPVWNLEKLAMFPARGSTLDQHAQVASQPPHLQEMISMYLSSFSQEVAEAMKRVWEKYPTSLRVKELFETFETFRLINRQLSIILARAAKRQRPHESIEHVYDLACGHGLLGVLVAHRFSSLHVVCVDLAKREAFDHYLEAFRCDSSSQLDNLEFLEGDLATVKMPRQSFVLSVHACNEANKTCVEMAVAAEAGFAAMPCCIRDGLYDSVHSVRHTDDDTRYAIMVGVMAQRFNAHTVSAIDRRITNRHLIMFGGYERASHSSQHAGEAAAAHVGDPP